MISVPTSTAFGARVSNFPTGLAGTVRFRILDNVGGITLAPTISGITENPAGSGSYIIAPTSPGTAGEYGCVWDTGAVGPSTVASAPLVVSTLVAALGETITPALPFETTVDGMPTGLGGTIGVRILNNVTGATTFARTTAGIDEDPDGSGRYVATLTAPSTEGYYSAFWDTGTVSPSTTAAEALNVFTVVVGGSLPSGADLCTLADVRAFLELPGTDTSRNTLIQTSITEASQTIMRAVEREFAPATADATRTFSVDTAAKVNGSVYFDFSPYDLRSVIHFKLHPEAASPTTLVSLTDYALMPTGPYDGVYTHALFGNAVGFTSDLSGRFGYTQAEIRGAWGFANVPTDVRKACVETVASWMRRDTSAFNIEEIEDPRSLAPNPAFVYSIPPSAWKKLRPFRRNGGF